MPIHLFSRGPVNEVSGGYLYNRQLLDALTHSGREVRYCGDCGDYDNVPAGATCIIDGLVLHELAPMLDFDKHRIVLLLHMNPLHNVDDDGDGVDDRAQSVRAALTRARVVVTGDATRDALAALPGGEPRDVITIEPGVPQDWRRKTTYSETARELLCVANYVDGKGHRRMIEALSGIDGVDWSLRVFGNAALEPGRYYATRKVVSDSGMASRVSLSTAIAHDDINKEMRRADLLLVFSRSESYSMVTAEAIAARLPVLSHPTGQIGHFKESGCVRYVDTLNPELTAAALRSLMSDASAYAALRPSGSHDARSWQQAGAEFVDWLEQTA